MPGYSVKECWNVTRIQNYNQGVGLPVYPVRISQWEVYSKICNEIRTVPYTSSYRGYPNKNSPIPLSSLYRNGPILNFNAIVASGTYRYYGYPKGTYTNIPSSGPLSIGSFYNFHCRSSYSYTTEYCEWVFYADGGPD